MKAALVVASNRVDALVPFFEKWQRELGGITTHLVLDQPRILDESFGPDVIMYSWQEIENDLGEQSWVIPRKTSAIKSYGIYRAWQTGVDMIVVLDDDCFPETPRFFEAHWENLHRIVHPNWHSTLPVPPNQYPRGYPYGIRAELRPVALSHGLWTENVDVDAVTAIQRPQATYELPGATEVVPEGMFFPMCGMNVAFRASIAPLMYFGLQGQGYAYDRYDDIWCGIIAKHCLDRLGMAVTSGLPYIRHSKASNPFTNLRREEKAMRVNETLWKDVRDIHVTGNDARTAMECIALNLSPNGVGTEYFERLKEAMKVWSSLFKEEEDGKEDSPHNPT